MEQKNYKDIREPAVAGQFYPADAGELKAEIEKYLNNVLPLDLPLSKEKKTAVTATPKKAGMVKAIMVPHAGYDYSAGVAAYGYKTLAGRTAGTVVLICNSHTAYFDGIAVDDHEAWRTPLGLVAVDKELAGRLAAADKTFAFNRQAHERDHTLEVQLPFLQTVLDGEFKILPLFFGNTAGDSYEKLAAALAENLGENDIIVISTDMSHYPNYEDAVRIDRATLEIIKTADITALEKHIADTETAEVPNEETLICGVDGVKTAMKLFKQKNWQEIEILHYANSGDAAIGDKDRVVGYGAVAFSENQNAKIKMQNDSVKIKEQLNLNDEQKNILLDIAKETVETYVRNGKVKEFTVIDERLNRQEGAFVTLHKNGQLRGCIGQIIPTGDPLWQVVRDMAVAACSEDPRFEPVSENELNLLEYEVSVLSAPAAVSDWQQIELGKQGVIVKKGFRSGVFLPQVAAETGWDLEHFLSELCSQKAGLPPDCYKTDRDVKLEVFTAQVFSEK
ncbi:MAG: AmmeMemoRadiSam system protein B [Planctomycetes bacterium]|nr:AmmeMemoRadiSam system protein B [Planctomycetota bacterium]